MIEPTVISLFSGIGGIDIAFIQAGFKVIWANDINKSACIAYRKNHPNLNIIESDIKNIDEKSIPKADIIVGGFPCQSFSVMGYQKGFDDPRGNLFFEIIRIAEKIKPKIILLENVKNLINHDNGKTFLVIFNTLAEIGYDIKYSLQNAKTHGNIPQDRERIFIAAFSDLNLLEKFNFPEKIKLTKSIDDIIDRSVKHSDIYYYKCNNIYYKELNKRINDKKGIYRIDDSGTAKRKYILAPTLKANMGTYHDRVPIIRDDFGIRKLTPYECLALQGFPENFSFRGISLNEAYKLCGNTVCVPVVKRIAENIYNVIRGTNL